MSLHTLERQIEIETPRGDLFPFFADAFNLERITPPDVRFRILTERPIDLREGTLIDYWLTLFGLPIRWRTIIRVWEPPVCFVDEQVRGPYRRWVHRHEFEELGERTLMRDRVEYALPLPPIGELAHPIVRRKLDHIFDFRAEAIRRLHASGGLRPTR